MSPSGGYFDVLSEEDFLVEEGLHLFSGGGANGLELTYDDVFLAFTLYVDGRIYTH